MAKRRGLTCVKFSETPPDTYYKPGHYSWVQNDTARKYIDAGYGKEYDPPGYDGADEEDKLEPASDIPEGLPGRHHFIEANIDAFDKVKDLADSGELQTIDGIGESTEHKINEVINGEDS